MPQLSQFLHEHLDIAKAGYGGTGRRIVHWCPGCETEHVFCIEGKQTNGASWTWDGNLIKPTFNPSMNIKYGNPVIEVCHYFLKAGRIQFLPDSTHKLSGCIVDLPSLPDYLTNRE